MREIILIVRRDKEYWLSNLYNTRLTDIIELWNKTFAMNIVDYRSRLRDIAAQLYLRNRFDKIFLHSCRNLRGYSISDEDRCLHRDSIFVPIDEDDWLSPILAQTLREIETDKPIFVWNFFATIRKQEKVSNRGKGITRFVQSCSWATVGYNYLLQKRNNLFLTEIEYADVYFINSPLAVKVEHIGSLGFLRKTIKKYPEQKDKWMSYLMTKLTCDMQMKVDFAELFKKEWEEYQSLLRELFSSRLEPWTSLINNK